MQQEKLEESVILRVHPNMAEKLREMISGRDDGDFSLLPVAEDDERASGRLLAFCMGSEVLPAHLVDLPCIVEAQKTFDSKTYFKAADICQMIVISDPSAPFDPQGQYAYPDGLTPPTKNIRKRIHEQPSHGDLREISAAELEIAAIANGKKVIDDFELLEIIEDDDEDMTVEAPSSASSSSAAAKNSLPSLFASSLAAKSVLSSTQSLSNPSQLASLPHKQQPPQPSSSTTRTNFGFAASSVPSPAGVTPPGRMPSSSRPAPASQTPSRLDPWSSLASPSLATAPSPSRSSLMMGTGATSTTSSSATGATATSMSPSPSPSPQIRPGTTSFAASCGTPSISTALSAGLMSMPHQPHTSTGTLQRPDSIRGLSSSSTGLSTSSSSQALSQAPSTGFGLRLPTGGELLTPVQESGDEPDEWNEKDEEKFKQQLQSQKVSTSPVKSALPVISSPTPSSSTAASVVFASAPTVELSPSQLALQSEIQRLEKKVHDLETAVAKATNAIIKRKSAKDLKDAQAELQTKRSEIVQTS